MSNMSPALLRFGDVSVRLSVELGRTDMPLRDVLSLGQGSVVALNRMTDELLDITANGKVVAQGEVIAQGGKFALRIVNLVGEDPSAAGVAPPMPMAPMGSAVPGREPAENASSTPAYTPVSEPQTQAEPPVQTQPPSEPASASAAPTPESSPAPEPATAASAAQPSQPAEQETPADPSAEPQAADADTDMDDLLDSTLDELADALDEIAPAQAEGDQAADVEDTGA